MSVVALQTSRFIDGLRADELLDDQKFLAAREAIEGRYSPDWYWEGDPTEARREAIKILRRRLEDRLRKDPRALARAWEAVFSKPYPTGIREKGVFSPTVAIKNGDGDLRVLVEILSWDGKSQGRYKEVRFPIGTYGCLDFYYPPSPVRVSRIEDWR